ncbi:MAG: VWA domain-containing protein [Chloroflexota bacterium]|nr:MAG: VWA domain-containing protein [Chloroflexota bacterium]
MQFLWSPVLWLLALLPLLIVAYVWLQTRRNKYALRYASLSLVKPALDTRAKWRRYLPPALFFLALAVMLVALARPVALVRTPKQAGVIILALDSSLSMRAEDMQPNRFEAARTAARSFIEKRGEGAEIGIVAFAGNAAIVQMPTTNQRELYAAINTLFLQRGTAIGEGILASLDAIALSDQDLGASISSTPAPQAAPTLAPVPPGTYIPAIVILLTDGQNRNGIDPLKAAQMASERGVRVYTVGIGSREGGVIPGGFGGFGGGRSFRQELDEDTLRAIADETDGEYLYAANAAELEKVYNNLGLDIVLRLEKTELTAWFTAAAALLLFSAVALSLVWNKLN